MPTLPIVLSPESSTSAANASSAPSAQVQDQVSPVVPVVESPTPPPPPPTPPKPVNRLRILPFPLKRDMRLAPTHRPTDLFAATSASSSKVSTDGGSVGIGVGAVAGVGEKPATGKGIAAWRALGFQIGKKSALPGASADTPANTSKSSASGAALGSSNPKDASALPEPLARMRATVDQHLENQVLADDLLTRLLEIIFETTLFACCVGLQSAVPRRAAFQTCSPKEIFGDLALV